MIAINKDVFHLHKDFGFWFLGFCSEKGGEMMFERPKKCLDCMGSKLQNDRVYCYEWEVMVLATHAKICPRFFPRKRRERRIKE